MASLTIRVCDTGFTCVCLSGYIFPTVGCSQNSFKIIRLSQWHTYSLYQTFTFPGFLAAKVAIVLQAVKVKVYRDEFCSVRLSGKIVGDFGKVFLPEYKDRTSLGRKSFATRFQL